MQIQIRLKYKSGSQYLVLEHVSGGELFDYLVKKGRLTPKVDYDDGDGDGDGDSVNNDYDDDNAYTNDDDNDNP